MLHTTHKKLYFLSGSIWLLVGMGLLVKGLCLLFSDPETRKLYSSFFLFLLEKTGEYAFLMYIGVSCILGGIKGQTIMKRVVEKTYKSVSAKKEPTHIREIFSRKQVLIIAIMMLLSFILRISGVPLDIRALISMAVGVALIQGAFSYFHCMHRVTDTSYL